VFWHVSTKEKKESHQTKGNVNRKKESQKNPMHTTKHLTRSPSRRNARVFMIAPSLCERKKIKKEESNKKREVKKGKAKKRLHQGEGRFVSVDVFLPTPSLPARGSSWQYRPPSLLVFFRFLSSTFAPVPSNV
jgi:hypothetical protein